MKKFLTASLATVVLSLAACASSTVAPGVGMWNVNLETPVGAMPAVLTMNADGSGMMSVDQLGETPLTGIMYDGNMVSFSASVDAQGQALTMTFSGTVTGDSLAGEFGTDFGALAVSGTRQ